jgi:ribosome-associated translation inhibitor RaiA
MLVPLQIAFRSMPASPAVETRIGECAAKLEKVHPRLSSCHVAVEPSGHHRNSGRLFAVHVELHAPDRTPINVSHEDEDVHVAVRDAFEAARRKLQGD